MDRVAPDAFVRGSLWLQNVSPRPKANSGQKLFGNKIIVA